MNAYPDWYKLNDVKFKLIGYLKNREMALIKPNHIQDKFMTTRMIRAHNVQSLDIWFKSMHILDSTRQYNLYYSLGRYVNGIPFSTLKLSERDFSDWKENHWKQLEGVDFLLDLDCRNFSEIDFAYFSANEIKEYFDKLEVPYNLRFSGCGFHFIIPYKYFFDLNLSFDYTDDKSIFRFYNDIAKKLNEKFSDWIDTSIYDARRVCKLPYSLSLYRDRVTLCYPIQSEDDWHYFQLKNMNPLFHKDKLRNYRECLFNGFGNIYKLLKELSIKCRK